MKLLTFSMAFHGEKRPLMNFIPIEMRKTLNIAIACFLIFLSGKTAISQDIPHLLKTGNTTQLIVDNKPFIVLGGELYNSSSSSIAFMDSIWEPLQGMNLNTVLAGVSWQLIEPEEDRFDFSLVDAMLKNAGDHHLKLILLWFGSWKNGLSHYTPDWVKSDTKRFPRVILKNGKPLETITPLSSEAANADARAFAALMEHVKNSDRQHTVIMIQVENEVGVIGSRRDYSEMATAEFRKPVPAALIHGLEANAGELQPSLLKNWKDAGSKKSGTWTEVFGTNAFSEEAFMAWNYAVYVNKVAAAGKEKYNLPMYVNSWIVQPQDREPGDYPSGGPQSHVHDIWRIGAPFIDIKAPDIYLPDFKGIVDQYHHSWNPLFVPESFSGITGAANAFYTVGRHAGLGYSPFGIDHNPMNTPESPLAKAYKVLDQLIPVITDAQAKGTITAVILDKKDSAQIILLGGYKLLVSLRKNWNGVPQTDHGYALIISSGNDEFIVAGADLTIAFVPDSKGPAMAGLASVYEGEYWDGKWVPGRLLNGDDIMISYKLAEEAAANQTGTGAKLNADPSILKVKLYRFE